MAFRLPDYNERPLHKNPYVLWGVGLAATSFGLHWWNSRKVPLDTEGLTPPANPAAGSANVSLEMTTFTPAQVAAFKAALPAAGQKYADLFVAAGAKAGVSPLLLAGLMSVESAYGEGCKDAACRGFHVVKGHGDYGLMQINSKWHPEFFASKVNGRPAYEDPEASVNYGAKVLRNAIASIKRNASPAPEGLDLLFAGVAGYNAGAGNVLKALRAGKSADSATWGGKYAKTVFKRVEEIMGKMNLTVG